MPYAIWYHLYNLKNVKNAHGGVLLLVKLQAKVACNFTKCNTPPCVFFTIIQMIPNRAKHLRNKLTEQKKLVFSYLL